MERHWAAANPVTVNLRELATRSHNTERPRILTPAQCQAITTAAKTMFDGELLAFVVLSTWCFMRRAEVIRTTPKDIDLSRGIVEVSPRKIGTPSYRRVSIPNNARTMLQWCIDQQRIPPTGVLFNRARFDAIRAAAGIVTLGPRTRRHARRAMLESAWQDNILRHTGISYLFAKSGDITDVCRQAGNSSSTAFRHYLDLPAPGAEKAFFKILP